MQPGLFHETIYDALREVIHALGGPKKIGATFCPERPVIESARWVNDCLNPERREKFSIEQVLWLLREGRRAGCHSGMNFLCAESGYAAAQPIEPKDELAELQRNFIEASKHLSRMADRIERLTGGK